MIAPENKILLGQLIMPRLEIDAYLVDKHYAGAIRQMVQDQIVGGFCVFGGNPVGVAQVVLELQGIASKFGKTPLILSCDCEFGLPMRLNEGGTEFPDAMAIAKTGEPDLAFKAGQAIAREMRALGLSWNFAPVADVNSNPQNPIINTRSFGEDPITVAEFSSSFMLGLQSEGVAAAAKHFPGHGDTSGDSHRELPIIEREWESFDRLELPPFQALIKQGVWSVMTGHLAAPKLATHLGASTSEQNLPATLSGGLTTILLREKLGFNGVIVTDALEMQAISKHFGTNEAALLAFESGADVLLLPFDPISTYNALEGALEHGRIGLDDVRKRVDRISTLKENTRVDISSINPERLSDYALEHSDLAKEIARKAIELTGDVRLESAKVIIITDDKPDAIRKTNIFEKIIVPFILEVKSFTTANWSSEAMEISQDTIIVTFHRARGYVNPIQGNRSVRSIFEDISASFFANKIAPRGIILFGSPYLDSEFRIPPGFILKTFSESIASVEAVAERLQPYQ
jgi:beta-N-acetylhexosaminidase